MTPQATEQIAALTHKLDDLVRLGFYAGVIWAECQHCGRGVTPEPIVSAAARKRFPDTVVNNAAPV